MFKPMDPDTVRSLIEGQEDVISQALEEEGKLFENLSCPMCYESGCEKRIDAPRVVPGPDGEPVVAASPFVSGRTLPQGYAHCIHCGTDFDPRTGFIRKTEATRVRPVELDPAAMIVSPQSDPHQE